METLSVTGVTETVVQYLRIQIIGGVLAPGQKLNEIELSSRLGVSRPPLREAFRILENEYLVVSIPRKGCYVTEVSIEDCREIFQSREMIECYAVDVLREKNIRELPRVASALEATVDLPMPTSSDPYERYDYLKAIADFHIRLVESAGNSRMVHCYAANFSNLARYQSTYVFIEGLMNASHSTHEHILHYIQEGDYTQAKEVLRSHIRGFLALMEDEINQVTQVQQADQGNEAGGYVE